MALFVIGDLHLSLGGSKPMDVFGGNWVGYVDKILKGFERVQDDDTVILCGDLSWGIKLSEAAEDFRFIDRLPGKKIIVKGNHDYWFETASKTRKFLAENNLRDMPVLNCNSFVVSLGGENGKRVSVCGTRGWINDDFSKPSHNSKIIAREAMRLRASLEAGELPEKYCFLHYPPRFADYEITELTDVMREFGVKKCYYGHLHGSSQRYAVNGRADGIEYNLISADFINFRPKLVR